MEAEEIKPNLSKILGGGFEYTGQNFGYTLQIYKSDKEYILYIPEKDQIYLRYGI